MHTIDVALNHVVDHIVQLSVPTLGSITFRPVVEGCQIPRHVHLNVYQGLQSSRAEVVYPF